MNLKKPLTIPILFNKELSLEHTPDYWEDLGMPMPEFSDEELYELEEVTFYSIDILGPTSLSDSSALITCGGENYSTKIEYKELKKLIEEEYL